MERGSLDKDAITMRLDVGLGQSSQSTPNVWEIAPKGVLLPSNKKEKLQPKRHRPLSLEVKKAANVMH